MQQNQLRISVTDVLNEELTLKNQEYPAPYR